MMRFSSLAFTVFVGLLCVTTAEHALSDEGSSQPASSNNAREYFTKGFNLLKAGNADEAVEEFKVGLKLDPSNARAWFYLGEARQSLGSNELAQTAFNKASALDPDGSVGQQAREKLRQIGGAKPNPQSAKASSQVALSKGSLQSPDDGQLHILFHDKYAFVSAISDDGAVIAGSVRNAGENDFHMHGYLWSREKGRLDLSYRGEKDSFATAMTPDGRIIGGYFKDNDNFNHAYIWTEATGIQDLGTMDGRDPQVTALSPDGQIVYGSARSTDGLTENGALFRWTSKTGFQELPSIAKCPTAIKLVASSGELLVAAVNCGEGDSAYTDIYSLTGESGWINRGHISGSAGIVGGTQNAQSAFLTKWNGSNARRGSDYSLMRWSLGKGIYEIGSFGGSSTSLVAVNVVRAESLLAAGTISASYSYKEGVSDQGDEQVFEASLKTILPQASSLLVEHD